MSLHRWLQNLFGSSKIRSSRALDRLALGRRARRSTPRRPAAAVWGVFEPLEDRLALATLSVSDISIIEGNSGVRNALVTVSLSGSSSSGVSVGYSTSNGSAAAGSDYQGVSGTLNFSKNVTSKTIAIPIYGDAVFEGDELFFVNLRNPKHATIADGQSVVNVLNDDTQIRIYDTWLNEGNSGTTNFNFEVWLSAAVSRPVTVNYATANGTATAGSDYQAVSGTLTIPAGQTSGIITVPVNGDNVSEPDETFLVNLSNPTNGTIADGQGVGTIVDDEPHIGIMNVAAAEGNGGTTAFNFTVALTTATNVPITVDFAIADGAATIADNDYVATAGTVTFAPGDTSETITVMVNGDTNVEADEDFVVNLSNPTNAQLDYSQGVGQILSDDNAVLHIDSSYWSSEPDPYYGGTTTFAFNVWLSLQSSETVTVDFSTLDGAATAGFDYLSALGALTFAPGETYQTIYVEVLADWDYEFTEEFYVLLSNPSSNALIQPGWDLGVGEIFDNQGDWWW